MSFANLAPCSPYVASTVGGSSYSASKYGGHFIVLVKSVDLTINTACVFARFGSGLELLA